MSERLDNLESRFDHFLSESWSIHNLKPFALTYVRLVLIFQQELPQRALKVLLEREKFLRFGGEVPESIGPYRRAIQESLVLKPLHDYSSERRKHMLDRLLFCALLDSEESDFFYLTEPIYEFAREMNISVDLLREILRAEFAGFE